MEALSPRTAIGIVGAGVMGLGIAQVAALQGHEVRLLDSREGAAAQALTQLGDTLAKQVAKGRLDAAQRDAALARLRPIATLEEFAGCGLVIEVIVELLEPKRALLRALDALLPPAVLLASNTSSISITALGNGLRHPERLVGMHFFNPVPLMQLVEVIRGSETAPAAAAAVTALAQAWGKTPVQAASTPGFIVNRIARPYYAETLALLQEQAGTPAELDACLRAAGFRMGPCELMDLIGHDTNALVTRSVWEANFGDRRYQPSGVQQALLDAGRLGRKSGRGFFAGPAPQLPVARGADEELDLRRLGEHGALAAFADLPAEPSDEPGLLIDGRLRLLLTDGRCAWERGAAVMDWPVQPGALALAFAPNTPDADRERVCAALAQRGWTPVALRDAPGLVVARTLAMLVNEAADAVHQGVCSEADADTAMRLGVNYPAGPFEWRERYGAAAVVTLLDHLWAHARSERYRVSPGLRAASGRSPRG